MVDTKLWIWLKNNPENYEEFREKKDENDVEVVFSNGNFYDLLKRKEQDRLSEIIAEIVDYYIPMQSRGGYYYDYSDDPITMVPDPYARSLLSREMEVLDEDLTLQILFRVADWDVPDEYVEMTERMRDVYDRFGFDNAMGYMFEEYLKEKGDMLELQPDEVEPVDFIRGMLELYRTKQMKDTEKPDRNDYVDMLICSHSIITNCDVLFMEEKWIDEEVIQNVVDWLTLDEPTLYKDYDKFLSEFYADGVQR
ncbi:hypothetical protein [Halobacterium salinarum]|uniref:hypothetical protein n=1 Tax=Halobacterium salinarum TaxID=2242 RepID=UPI0025543432|nr:hypothetical protein [Halobacterium salinarum]MDL0144530.1 hypothetical protein [Halobacterium salinarum]